MRRTFATLSLLFATTLGGCGVFWWKEEPPSYPVELTVYSPYAEPRTFAIAPTINLSGAQDFDPLVVSDILYGEMQQVQGLNVLPLNKTLVAMQRLNTRPLSAWCSSCIRRLRPLWFTPLRNCRGCERIRAARWWRR